MTLDLQPADSLVLLQLPPGSPKCIPQCYIRVRMSRVFTVCMSDDDLFAGKGYIDLEIKQRPLLVALMVRCLHDHLALDDLVAETLQLPDELANATLERRGGIHVAKCDLQLHSLNLAIASCHVGSVVGVHAHRVLDILSGREVNAIRGCTYVLGISLTRGETTFRLVRISACPVSMSPLRCGNPPPERP
jgi:hypothetical protein